MHSDLARLTRYGLATLGPLSVSLAHFLASLLMLRLLQPAEFGLFAFILVVVQFCFGLSNALIGTPFTVRANQQPLTAAQEALFFQVNLLLSICSGLFCGVMAFLMGAGTASILFAAFSSLAVMRWFMRSYLYALHLPTKVALSDFAYALALALGLCLAWMFGITLFGVATAFVVAAGLALASSPASFGKLFAPGGLGSLAAYRAVWREQSRWTLLGVVSTEATSNAHSWLVSLIAGPAAFAPLAAASLLFRPVGLCGNSLTQLERPAITSALTAKDAPRALRITRHFRIAMLAAWGATCLAAAMLLYFHPSLLLKNGYDFQLVAMAAAIQAIISLLFAWRTPDSTFIQAADKFALLAKAAVVSGVVAVSSAAALLLFFDPLSSLLGVLAGQVVMAWRISRLSKTLKASYG